jgi:hypothetical protein
VVSLVAPMTTLIHRVARFILEVTVKEGKFKPTGDKHWFDRLSRPGIPAHLKPLAKTA